MENTNDQSNGHQPKKQKKPRSLPEWYALNPLFKWRAEQTPPATQESVGDVAGTSRTSVLYWEKGQFWPRPSCMQALADLMKISMPDLHTAWAQWVALRPATKHAGVSITKRLRDATRFKVEAKKKRRAARKTAATI